MEMERPRATRPSLEKKKKKKKKKKKNQKMSVLEKNSGKLHFSLHRLIEKFSVFYLKCVRLP